MADEQAQTAWNRIVERHGLPTCPICQAQNWKSGRLVSQLDGPLPHIAVQWLRRTVQVRASTATLAVPCALCGYTLHFDYRTAIVRQG